jgi:hypothetical protein
VLCSLQVKLGDHVIIAERKRQKKPGDDKKRKKQGGDKDYEVVNDEMVLRVTEIFISAKVSYCMLEGSTPEASSKHSLATECHDDA